MTGGDGDPGDERPVFAHGKVILLGEHAVVHGHPALAAAVDRGVAARGRVAQEPDATVDRLRVAPWGVDVAVGPGATPTPEPVRPLARAFQAILDGFSGTRPRVEVRRRSPAQKAERTRISAPAGGTSPPGSAAQSAR